MARMLSIWSKILIERTTTAVLVQKYYKQQNLVRSKATWAFALIVKGEEAFQRNNIFVTSSRSWSSPSSFNDNGIHWPGGTESIGKVNSWVFWGSQVTIVDYVITVQWLQKIIESNIATSSRAVTQLTALVLNSSAHAQVSNINNHHRPTPEY